MVQQRRLYKNAKTGKNCETLVDEAKSATLIGSFKQKNKFEENPGMEYIKDPGKRWKLVTPCSLPVPMSFHGTLRRKAQLDIDDCLLVSAPVILLKINQQQEQMIFPAITKSHASKNFCGLNRSSHYCDINAQSVSAKDSSGWSDSCILPNKLPESGCHDSSLASSESHCGIDSKISTNSRKKYRKKGNKKRKLGKRPPKLEDHVNKEETCGKNHQNFPAFEASLCSNMDNLSTYILDKNTQPLAVSGLSMQLITEKPDGKENDNDLSNGLNPTCKSNAPMVYPSCSDSMGDSEPSGLYITESSCESSLCNFCSSPKDHSQCTSFSNGINFLKVAPSSFENSSIAPSKPDGACNNSSSCHSSQGKSPLADAFSDDWTSGINNSSGNNNVKILPAFQDDLQFRSSECQTVFGSSRGNSTWGTTVSSSCERKMGIEDDRETDLPQKGHDSMVIVANKSTGFGYHGYHKIGFVDKTCLPEKRGTHDQDSYGKSNMFIKVSNPNPRTKLQKDIGHPIWRRVQKNCDNSCIPKNQIPKNVSDANVPKGLEERTKTDGLFPSLNKNETSNKYPTCDKFTAHSVTCSSAGKVNSSMLGHHSKSEKVVQMNRMLQNHGSNSNKGTSHWLSKQGTGSENKKTFSTPKAVMQEQTALDKLLLVGQQESKNLHFFDRINPSNIFMSTATVPDSFSQYSEENRKTCFSQTTSLSDKDCSLQVICSPTLNKKSDLQDNMMCRLEQQCPAKLHSEKVDCMFDRAEQNNCLIAFNNSDIASETADINVKNCNYDNISGFPKQKWVRVGEKDASKVLSYHCNFAVGKENCKTFGEDAFQPLRTCSLKCSSSDSKIVASPIQNGHVQNSWNKYGHVSDGRIGPCANFGENTTSKESASCHFKLEDLGKIIQAVTDANGLQTASEFIHLHTGRPLAEFEKMLHSASPVISQIPSLPDCIPCSRDQIVNNSLCRHQIPNISLGNLWHWYEKHGSYGLEIKVEDKHTKQSDPRSTFRAYFVPYLSAIQLFGQSRCSVSADKSNFYGKGNVSCDKENSKDSCKMDRLPTCASTHPVISLLLPQAHGQIPGYLAQDTKTGDCNISTNIEEDGALLFEYFESDPPQQRPPLFEKIKMLIRGEGSLNSHTFGDPSNLECLQLQDINPASWFSVAWYPIYRIPDGSLRASFLTYHSLGNFTHRSINEKLGPSTCIVSPVVGLQSYNSKGECWFQLGDSNSTSFTTEDPSLHPPEVLKERLRTLNQAAMTMARASVRKHGQKSINRQPDYEFFVSRAW